MHLSARARITVVVPARDAAATLPATLAALEAQDVGEPFEVLVVDNGSADATPELAEASPVVTRVIRRQRGAGPGAARNDGVAAATAPVVAFTDSDCAPDAGWLAGGLAAIEDADIVQGRVHPGPPGARGPFIRTLSVQSEYGLYETANLFVRREWFERIGPFEDFIPAGGRPFGEDTWWVWRARRAGARTAFAREALVSHAILPGDARSYLREHAQRAWFPELVAKVPELRDAFLWRRWFLNPRTAAFDLALAGTVAAAVMRHPAPLLAAVPYGRALHDAGRRGARTALVDVAADAVTAAALARGSARARTLVL